MLDATPTICPTVYKGWGGVGIVTFLRPRSCDLAQDVDATLTWSGVGMLTFLRPRSLNLAQDVDASSHGWGGVRMLTFLRPRSLDLAQDVDATLTRGGHMMGLHLDGHKHKFKYIDILTVVMMLMLMLLLLMMMIPSNSSRRGANAGSWSQCYQVPRLPRLPRPQQPARVVVQRVVGARSLRATTSLVRWQQLSICISCGWCCDLWSRRHSWA